MCDLFGSSGPSAQDLAAQQAQMTQAQEDQRTAAIGQGRQSIDSAFSQFTPDYYSNYTKAYTAAQDAPLADQYGIAKDQLTAALAGRDTLGSSSGNNAIAQLDKTNEDAQGQIGNAAVDATNSLKSTVNNSKNNLYAENTAAADPLAAASEAQAGAGSIVAPSSVPTMSNVFAGALQPFATAQKVNQQSMYPNSVSTASLSAPLSGSGSAVFG